VLVYNIKILRNVEITIVPTIKTVVIIFYNLLSLTIVYYKNKLQLFYQQKNAIRFLIKKKNQNCIKNVLFYNYC
jgi:hypothetical protein